VKALEAVRAAISRAFGTETPDPLIKRGDDLKTAFARHLGIPVIDRPEPGPDEPQIRPNRTDRRRARTGASIRANRGSDYTPRTSPRAAKYDGLPRVDVLARRARRAGRGDLAGALDLARTGSITLTRKDTTE
jgi:hypothetical protein